MFLSSKIHFIDSTCTRWILIILKIRNARMWDRVRYYHLSAVPTCVEQALLLFSCVLSHHFDATITAPLMALHSADQFAVGENGGVALLNYRNSVTLSIIARGQLLLLTAFLSLHWNMYFLNFIHIAWMVLSLSSNIGNKYFDHLIHLDINQCIFPYTN